MQADSRAALPGHDSTGPSWQGQARSTTSSSSTSTSIRVAAEGFDYASSCVGRGITSPASAYAEGIKTRNTFGERVRGKLFSRFSLLCSTAFRMGILFWLLCTACFGVAAYVVYESLQDRLLARMDLSIAERFAHFQQIYLIDGIDAVIRIGEARNSSPMTSSMGFHLSTAEWERIAGNVPICLTQRGLGHSGRCSPGSGR
jgi:hypothetical protein